MGIGVIGATSWVARDAVLPALAASPRVRLVAVGSRDGRAAAEVADRFGAPHHFDGYEAVVAHPDVEAVYVPLPNGRHREWTERAAKAGKHVLCEKPLAPTEDDGRAMVAACEEAGVVLMEAYMTPFHPRAEAVSELLGHGALGRPLFARAAFTFPLTDPGNYRWMAQQGGGALLDVGVYCLTPLVELGGEPETVAATAVMGATGVDVTFSGWLGFADGFSAAFVCSFDAPERQHLEVTGTLATLMVDGPFAGGATGTRARLLHRDGRLENVGGDDGDPYLAMVEHFAAAVRGVATPRRTPSASVAMLGLFDRLRVAAEHGHPVRAA
ncbi:MAG: Gfo/Idh/MocA family oxidoreductase [Actinomycetota bacterium]|nr:Gfo/Idh/MocA family oxidoreductase [Actinomycetota bacterium]